MARSTPWSAAHRAVRSGSRPATAAAVPPATLSAGRNAALAMLAVLMMPQRTGEVVVMTATYDSGQPAWAAGASVAGASVAGASPAGASSGRVTQRRS